MFLKIENLLHADEVDYLISLSRRAEFIDGKSTNPNSLTKNNLQVSRGDVTYYEAAKVVNTALQRNKEVSKFAFPRIIAPALMTKHDDGMYYGLHCDAPFMLVDHQRLRSDISCTIFLHDPEIYDGGELSVRLGTQDTDFKPKAGTAILYPSTTLHQVRQVTRGTRLCMITFIQSAVADQSQRDILYQLSKIKELESRDMKWDSRTKLSYVCASLERMWSE